MKKRQSKKKKRKRIEEQVSCLACYFKTYCEMLEIFSSDVFAVAMCHFVGRTGLSRKRSFAFFFCLALSLLPSREREKKEVRNKSGKLLHYLSSFPNRCFFCCCRYCCCFPTLLLIIFKLLLFTTFASLVLFCSKIYLFISFMRSLRLLLLLLLSSGRSRALL